MRISFEITIDDVVAASLLHHYHSPATRWTRLFNRAIGPFIVGLLLLAWLIRSVIRPDAEAADSRWNLTLLSVLALPVALAWPWLARWTIASSARQHVEADPIKRIMLGTCTMEIAGNRLLTKKRLSEDAIEIQCITDVVEFKDYALIYFGPNQIQVIPLKSVPPEQDYRAFAAALRGAMQHTASPPSDAMSERPAG